MIKFDNLVNMKPLTPFTNGITLQESAEAFLNHAQDAQIPVAFRYDQVKSGGLFNSQVDDCLVLYHPDHPKDYFNFCIRTSRQGANNFVSLSFFGTSKQEDKSKILESSREPGQGTLSRMLLKSSAIGLNKMKIEEEQIYYEYIASIFKNVFFSAD